MSAVKDAGARAAIASATRRGRRFHRCSCGRPIPEEVKRCSSPTCPEFAPIWARDTRRRLFVNLEQLKLSVMFSITAPGGDIYPFDPRLCSHSSSERCSGRLGCRVDPEMARGVQPESPESGGANCIAPPSYEPTAQRVSKASSRPGCGRSRNAA